MTTLFLTEYNQHYTMTYEKNYAMRDDNQPYTMKDDNTLTMRVDSTIPWQIILNNIAWQTNNLQIATLYADRWQHHTMTADNQPYTLTDDITIP